MSLNHTDEEDSSDGSLNATQYASDVDPFLADVISDHEFYGITQDVTLNLQGFLISGTPAAYWEYFELHGKLVDRASRQAAGHLDDAAGAARLLRWAAVARTDNKRQAEALKLPELIEGDTGAEVRREAAIAQYMTIPRRHITLKRASIVLPDGTQLDVPLWRGRLNQVAGWTMGRWAKRDYEGLDPDAIEDDDWPDLVDRLAEAGWYLGGMTRSPHRVELHLRPAPETSGEPVRTIVGTDENDAIRRELQRLAAAPDEQGT
jgi:hypothetical protein